MKKLRGTVIKLFSIICILILFVSNAQAEVIKKIKIEGNNRVSEETIKLYGEIDLNKDYQEKDIDQILKNLYATEFFEDVKINLQSGTLIIKLKEYPVINQLVILGEKTKNYKEQIRKTIKSKSKKSFIKSNLAKDIELIKNLYSSQGYNFTKVDANFKKIDDSRLDLILKIDRGERTKISKISFLGNNNVRSSRLRDVVASEEDKFWKIITKNTNLTERLVQLDKRLLSNYYKSLGFYDIKISSNLAEISRKNTAELIYSIDEGNRYIIKKISTNVDSVFDKELFFDLNKDYEKYIGEYYSPFKIKKLLENLDQLIDKNNLQFVEHNVQETFDEDKIIITFNVFEGKKTLVERINIIGNNITNEEVIRGELILDEGDPFTKLNLDKSIAKIQARNIFKKVDVNVTDGSKNNLKVIDVIVEEKPTGEISAGAGIGTDGGMFAFNIKENNWLGQGKSVAFDVEVDSESLSGTLSFVDPNYNFLGNSINYFVSSESNDKPDQGYENTIISSGIGTSFEQYKNMVTSLGLNASFDDLRTDNTASDSLKKQSGNFSDLSGNYGFKFDSRDRVFMPRSGSITSFGQSFPFVADKSFIANTFSHSSYKTLNEDVVGVGKFYLSSINGIGSDDVRLSKRRGLGNRRLRGFERNKVGPVDGNDHVGGNYAAALNLEANLPNLLPEDTNTDINLFLDFGNVWGVDYDSSIDKSNKIRSSTGIMASWISPIGPMTFTLSQNLSKASTDETQSFNFQLGTTF